MAESLEIFPIRIQTGGGVSALYTAATAIWDFNDNMNDTKGDSNYNLTPAGTPTYGNSTMPPNHTSNKYVILNGTSQYGSSTNSVFNLYNTDYSLSFWFRLASQVEGAIFTRYDNSSTGDGYRIVNLYVSTDEFVAVQHLDNYAPTNHFVATTATTDSTWWHVCFSYDYSVPSGNIWISTSSFGNIHSGTAINPQNIPNVASDTFYLGYHPLPGYFPGYLYEVVLWKGTLIDSTNAQNLYNGTWR